MIKSPETRAFTAIVTAGLLFSSPASANAAETSGAQAAGAKCYSADVKGPKKNGSQIEASASQSCVGVGPHTLTLELQRKRWGGVFGYGTIDKDTVTASGDGPATTNVVYECNGTTGKTYRAKVTPFGGEAKESAASKINCG